MMIKINRRFGRCPFAAVLFGAATLSLSFADQQSHAGNAQAPGGHEAPDSTGEMPVDISVSVQHGGRNDHDETRGQQKTFRVVPAAPPKVRAATPSVGTSIVGRNAIGQPIVGRQPAEPRAATAFGRPPAQPSRPPASGIDNFRSPVTTQAAVPQASPPLPMLSRGRIDGSALIRPRTVPPGPGGPSAPIGGINGTTFTPKR